jgi:hypothetical protein
MDSDELTKEQAETLLKTVLPMLDFLRRLEGRMTKIGFPVRCTLFAWRCTT